MRDGHERRADGYLRGGAPLPYRAGDGALLAPPGHRAARLSCRSARPLPPQHRYGMDRRTGGRRPRSYAYAATGHPVTTLVFSVSPSYNPTSTYFQSIVMGKVTTWRVTARPVVIARIVGWSLAEDALDLFRVAGPNRRPCERSAVMQTLTTIVCGTSRRCTARMAIGPDHRRVAGFRQPRPERRQSRLGLRRTAAPRVETT
jgi:hypothetical protein